MPYRHAFISGDNHTKHRFRAIKKYNLMRGSSAIASSLVRRGGLIRAGVAQDPKTPLLVGHVDVTARVDEDVLRLSHEVAR